MTQLQDEKADAKAKKDAIAERTAANQAEETRLNANRTGKGTRVAISMSRGKSPVKVVYEAFDEQQPDTLPKTLGEFMDLTKIDTEAAIMPLLIDGYNSFQYTTASDPVAEFVDAAWSDDLQKSFRTVVRQYAANVGSSIEDAVSLIKPGFVASHAKAAKAV